VNFLSTSGNIAVTAQDSCGVSAASTRAVSVTVVSGIPTVINGDHTVCANAVDVPLPLTVQAPHHNMDSARGSGTFRQGTTSVRLGFGNASGIVT